MVARYQCAIRCQDAVYLVNEEVPAVVAGIYHTSLLDFTSHTVAEGVFVLLGAQIGNVSSREKVVDVHQELLIDNLVVSHKESDCGAFHSSLYSSQTILFWEFVTSHTNSSL